jgi:hypothetical protein
MKIKYENQNYQIISPGSINRDIIIFHGRAGAAV